MDHCRWKSLKTAELLNETAGLMIPSILMSIAAPGSKRFLFEKKDDMANHGLFTSIQGIRIAVKTIGTLSMIALFIWQVYHNLIST